jgi:hypothetical protein
MADWGVSSGTWKSEYIAKYTYPGLNAVGTPRTIGTTVLPSITGKKTVYETGPFQKGFAWTAAPRLTHFDGTQNTPVNSCLTQQAPHDRSTASTYRQQGPTSSTYQTDYIDYYHAPVARPKTVAPKRGRGESAGSAAQTAGSGAGSTATTRSLSAAAKAGKELTTYRSDYVDHFQALKSMIIE